MKRPLFACGCAFVASAAVCFYLGFTPALSLAALTAAGGLLPLGRSRRSAALLAALSMVASVGCCAAHYSFRLRPIMALIGQDCQVSLTLLTAEQSGRRTAGEALADLTAPDGRLYRGVGVRFSAYGEEPLTPGEGLSFGAQAQPASLYASALSRRLSDGLYLSFDIPADVRPLPEPPHAVRGFFARLRHRIDRALIYGVGGDAGGLLSALVTGSRRGLSGRAEGWLARSGLMHLTSVSGLHVTAVAGWPALLLPPHRRKYGYLVGCLLAFAYAGLAGFAPSALRAAVMFGLFAIAQSLGRRADGLTSLSVAAVLLCLISPLSVGDLGLQFSFLATLGILTLSPRLSAILSDAAIARWGDSGWMKLVIGAVAVSVGALLPTAPLSAMAFGYLPLLGLPANLMVMVLLPFVLPMAAMMAVLFLMLPGLAAALSAAARLMVGPLLGVSRLVSGLPFSVLYVRERHELLLLTAICIGIMAIIGLRPGRRVVIGVLCCAVIATGSAFITHRLLYLDSFELLVFEDNGCTALIDGPEAVLLDLPEDGYGVTRVAGALERLGVRRIALVTAHNPQTVRLMGERLPIYLCRTAEGTHPLTAEVMLPHRPVEVEAIGLPIYIDAEGGASLSGQNPNLNGPIYAIMAKSQNITELSCATDGAARYAVRR